jgi:hypothetical protein
VQEKYIKRRGNVAMEETYERDFNKNGPRILKKKVIAPENSKIQTNIRLKILKTNKNFFPALPIPPSLFLRGIRVTISIKAICP